MNSRMKAPLTVGVVSVLTLAGCASGASTEGGSVDDPAEITFLTFQSPNLRPDFWKVQVADIQKLYPNLKVNIEYMLQDKFVVGLASGATKG